MGGKRIDADPQLAVELAVCADYRIPHSEFLAWRSTDRDKAIWWLTRQRAACPACGTRPEEWDPEQGGHRRAYIARKHRCYGCEARQQVEASIDPEKEGRGVHVVLEPGKRA